MSKHDEFRTVVNTLKAASPTISAEQRIGLLRQAVQQYDLSADEASKIIEASGLVVGEEVNYFETLGLSIEELESQSESDIAARVDDIHDQLYKASLSAGGRVRPDGKSEAQWRVLLNQARDTLKDAEGRQKHIVTLQRDKDDISLNGDARLLFKFPNGAEATSIPQLAELMMKNPKEATDALYRGYLEQSLGRAGEMHFATAARAATDEFSENRELGLKAMVQILKGNIAFQHGIEAQTLGQPGQKMTVQKQNEAGTPQQIAQLIDLNWEQAKAFLYNGFMAYYLEYTKQAQLASIAKEISTRYSTEKDMGLEMLVQELDPQIGKPEPQLSHTHIDFGKVDAETQKTMRLQITNTGRGFLYGDVQLADGVPGFQLLSTPIRGEGSATVKLDASQLTVKRMHEVKLVANTNGGNLQVPISCYVDYLIIKSILRVGLSSVSVGAITLMTCLIILLREQPGWLTTRLTQGGFIGWTQYWNWLWSRWGEWFWIEWTVYKFAEPGASLGFVIAFGSLGVGIFLYWYHFFKKKRVR